MTEKLKRAVVYARVSTQRQADEELPIAGQIERCKSKAADLGAEVVHVFSDEGISGQGDNRPAFQQAIAYCETFGVDYFVTWSTSRFARNHIDAGMYKRRLDRAGTSIVYITTNIDRSSNEGWILESVLELFDELYSRQVATDTLRSMIKNARDGYWNGGNPPFGFSPIADAKNSRRRRLQPDPSEAPIVQRIFDLRLQGYGTKTIATLLNREGFTNRGKPWQKNMIRSLLQNDAVAGRIVFGRKDRKTGKQRPRNDWIIVESHEAVVPIEKWDAVQQLLNDTDGRAGGTPRSDFVFSGILRCGQCGGSMQAETARGRSKSYHYYNCRTFQTGMGCASRRINAPALDRFLIDELVSAIFTKESLTNLVNELKQTHGDWARKQKQRRQAIAIELTTTRAKITKLYEILELHGKDAPNLGDLTGRLRQHTAKTKQLEQQLADLDVDRPAEVEISAAEVEDLSQVLRELVHSSAEAKTLRAFFSTFIEAVHLDGGQVRVQYYPARLLSPPTAVHNEIKWLPGTDSNRRPSD